MTPKTLEERMATIEAEYGHIREALHEVTQELKSTNAMLRDVPGLVSRRIRKHSKICVASAEQKPQPPASNDPPGWGWLQKTLAGLLILGSLIGGMIWGPRPTDITQLPAITAPVQHPQAQTGGNP